MQQTQYLHIASKRLVDRHVHRVDALPAVFDDEVVYVIDVIIVVPEAANQRIRASQTVVVTYGELGSTIYDDHGKAEYRIPAARARKVVDPTGAGDGYRAGLIRGMLAGLPWEIAGRLGSQAATFVVEVKGTQSHEYSSDEFVRRFTESFPEYADVVKALPGRPALAGRTGER